MNVITVWSRLARVGIQFVAVCLLSGAAPLGFARAQDAMPGTVTVTGSGEAKAKAAIAVIDANVRGEAELAADAIVKYRDARRRAAEALEKLKLPNLSVVSDGFSINKGMDSNQQAMIMRGIANAGAGAGKQQVQIVEQLKLTLKDMDKLESEKAMEMVLKVLDAAREAGLAFNTPPASGDYYQMQAMAQSGTGPTVVSFRLADAHAARDEAYKLALADARAKAQRIAADAGIQIGKVTGISDQQTWAVTQNAAPDHGWDPPPSANLLGAIPVRASVNVEFEIVGEVKGK